MPSRLATAAFALITLPVMGQSAPNAPSGTVDNPMHVGNGVKPPTMLYSADADYKLTDDEKKHIGDIFLGFIVDEQGVPQKVHAIRCTHKDLCDSAMEAIRKYRFRPATYQGRPIAVELSMNVNIDAF